MIKVIITWGHVNPKPGFVSAWDATKANYNLSGKSFDALTRFQQVAAVREYVNR